MITLKKISIVVVILTIYLTNIPSAASSEADIVDTSATVPLICSILLAETVDDTDFEPVDWTEATHSKKADPNFEVVFDSTVVKRLDFVITPETWQLMLDNMTELYGEFGLGSGPGGPGAPDVARNQSTLVENEDLLEDVEDPTFVQAEVFYNGIQWYRVGIRFKGNSTLQGSWRQGILKLSFKLDFDEYEDDYPQIKNQRFYGIKKFSLKNNYEDSSMLREQVTADVLRNAGLAVSHTAFYALYIDHGYGPQYFGLYTLVEEVDDTVIETQFANDDGNLYKPEDGSASFLEGTFNTEDFEKKTNEDDEDWSDIETLFSALHNDSRTAAPASWRAELESIFNVDQFLKYLATSGIIQNWDSYGRMPHNFYLYNDPDSSTLTWIPWDHNETLQEGKNGGALALDFSNISSGNWPLIEKIYSDSEYKKVYDNYVLDVIENAFDTDTILATYDFYAALIEDYATTERSGYSFLNNPSDFYRAVTELKEHARARATAVDEYLND